MEYCLSSPESFKKKYSKNPIISKAIISGLLGIGTTSAVIGVAASSAGTVAATTGIAGLVGHFASWPLVGGLASSFVSSTTAVAATTAIGATLPISLAVGGGIAGSTILLTRKKTAPYQKGTGLDKLARTVSTIIFLPLFAKYKKILEDNIAEENTDLTKSQQKKTFINLFGRSKQQENSDEKELLQKQAKDAAIERVCEWGYSEKYATELVDNSFLLSSKELESKFNSILEELNKLNKKDTYDGIPKYELPPIGIQKIAKEIEKS